MLRTAFKLALRQTEGLMTSVLHVDGPDALSAGPLPRSAAGGDVAGDPASTSAAGPLHVLIDSTGLQVYGAGQWLEAEAWREVAPDVAQAASGGGCGQRHDPGTDADRSGR